MGEGEKGSNNLPAAFNENTAGKLLLYTQKLHILFRFVKRNKSKLCIFFPRETTSKKKTPQFCFEIVLVFFHLWAIPK